MQAELGEHEAQLELAMAYDSGQGVSRSEVNARKWYLKAAESNSAEAQNSLGSIYQTEEKYHESKKR